MTDELHPEFELLRRHLTEQHGPILGAQAASLGAERFMRFTQGHGKLQAMALFLVMSVSTMPYAGYSDDALDALRQDAQDLRDAAEQWASDCEQLADPLAGAAPGAPATAIQHPTHGGDMRDLRNAPEQYPGEALDCAMMLARLDHGEDEIAASIERNFPTAAPAARQLAKDALIAVQAERS